jgi:hypothetical protein
MYKLVLNAKHRVSVINKLSDRHHLLKYLLCFVKYRHRTKYIYVWLKEFECYGQFLYSFIFPSFPIWNIGPLSGFL